MDTFKTGKKNKKQVSQYVKYTGMDSLYTCLSPNLTAPGYIEGENFPACPLFQSTWSPEEAEANGYTQPFATSFANRIEGSDANLFGRPVTSEKLQVFVSDIYRSCYLIHTEDVDLHGLSLRRYELQDKDLYNASTNPANAQFYNFAPNGMENATKATGVPLFISFPNFLNADKRLVAAVKGVSPSKEAHTTYLDVEPQSGLIARGTKKLQINYLMESKYFPTAAPDALIYAHSTCLNITSIILSINKLQPNDPFPIPDCNNTELNALLQCLQTPSNWTFENNQVYFPYGWANEHFTIADSDAEDLKTSLYGADDFAEAFQFWCIVIAVVAFILLAKFLLEDFLCALNEDTRAAWATSLSSFGNGYPIAAPSEKGSAPPTIGAWATEPLLTGDAAANQIWVSPQGKSRGFSFST